MSDSSQPPDTDLNSDPDPDANAGAGAGIPPPNDSPLREPRPSRTRRESKAELYTKLLVGVGAFAMFCALGAYDVTHPTISVPQVYLYGTLAITAGVFGLDVIQRAGANGR